MKENVMDIKHGDYVATVMDIGASLVALRAGKRPLVVTYDSATIRPHFRGATLAPWPNRVVDGHYTWRGVDHQLPITEVDRHHALHGLVAWSAFEVTEQRPDAVTLATTLVAQPGYPWWLRIEVRYALDDDGLSWTIAARNLSDEAAPYGVSAHPYVIAGPGHVDDWTLEIPADSVCLTRGDRLLPDGTASVVDTPFDYREARLIGGAKIDYAYTGFSDRRVRVGYQGHGVEVTWPAECGWVQVHTADRPEPEHNRVGMAIEPMTCAPDAFNNTEGLITLEPGESFETGWRIAAF